MTLMRPWTQWRPPQPGQVRGARREEGVVLSHSLTSHTATPHYYTHTFTRPKGMLYLLISVVAICYWMQGNAAKQEYEDNEREEASLLSADKDDAE